MRGRPPTPVEQRIREGTDRPDRTPAPLLVSGRPELEEFREPPENLPERAKEFWREVVVDLVRAGLVDRVDRPALRMLSVQWDRWEKAMEVLNAEGLVSLGSMGQMVEHPMLKTERNAHELFLKTSEHFALTPVARTRLGLAELHRRTIVKRHRKMSVIAIEKCRSVGSVETVAVDLVQAVGPSLTGRLRASRRPLSL